MKIKAVFQRKEAKYETEDCEISRVVELPQNQYHYFATRLLAEHDFLVELRSEMGFTEDGVRHCLLVLPEGGDDGILVDAQGSNYARYSAFLPNARQQVILGKYQSLTDFIEINRYDAQGQLITEPAGVMIRDGMYDNDTYVNSVTFPDEGYSQVEITNLAYELDRELVQSKLCQTCLDSINDLWFGDLPPSEFAVVSLKERTIHGLVDTCPWFSVGEFGVDCEYEEDGDIDLLIHCIALRYHK